MINNWIKLIPVIVAVTGAETASAQEPQSSDVSKNQGVKNNGGNACGEKSANGFLKLNVKNRIISKIGNKYCLAFDEDGPAEKSESPRKTRLSEDFDALRTIYAEFTDTPIFSIDTKNKNILSEIDANNIFKPQCKINENSAAADKIVSNSDGDCSLEGKAIKYKFEFSPELNRANVKFKFNNGNEYDLVTGPQEHWYLTADVIVSSLKTLNRGSDGAVNVRDDPKSFYVGFNWRLGDVLTDYSSEDRGYAGANKFIPVMNKLAAKFMVAAANKPHHSIGIGVSYATDNVEFFVARIRNKNFLDGGAVFSYGTHVGISFSLDRAVDWISGISKSDQ
ncbi:MAG: hypothetical protein RLY71_2891 [Pseudomonadota bacterium]|jgi:hypothetical protein